MLTCRERQGGRGVGVERRGGSRGGSMTCVGREEQSVNEKGDEVEGLAGERLEGGEEQGKRRETCTTHATSSYSHSKR